MKISNEANLPTKFGKFKIKSFTEGECKEHLVIYTKELPEIPMVRVHSECLTGDGLGSLKCDCGDQLHFALETINENGGMVIYLRQEGRDIGLFNKVNAYALQDIGFDTVEANHQLGFEADMRDFSIVSEILEHFNISKIKLLTNNPKKLSEINGVEIVERVPIIVGHNENNEGYLQTKKDKMGHLI